VDSFADGAQEFEMAQRPMCEGVARDVDTISPEDLLLAVEG